MQTVVKDYPVLHRQNGMRTVIKDQPSYTYTYQTLFDMLFHYEENFQSL